MMLADDLEHLLQASDLNLGLALVGLEGRFQLGRLRAPRHLGQSLQDRALGIVDVLERVMKQGLEIFLGHWDLSDDGEVVGTQPPVRRNVPKLGELCRI